jgi:hypothetical protein
MSHVPPRASRSLTRLSFAQSYSLGGTQFWVPDKTKINATNSASGYGSIGFHVGNCESIWG